MKNQTSNQYRLMKEGSSYSFDECLFRKQKECSKLLTAINNLPFGSRKRETLFYKLFSSMGNNTIIKANFQCNFGFNIRIGEQCFINHNVTILDSAEVEIGNNVFIAPNVVISPVTHPLESRNRRNLIVQTITIEDDAWIGTGSVILPGVRVGKGAVIGANSLVKSNVESYTIVGGSPAKFIKKIENE